MITSRSKEFRLSGNGSNVFSWASPLAKTRDVTLTLTSQYMFPFFGLGVLPRARITWGGDAVQHVVTVDMPGILKVGLTAASLTVEMFAEQDDPLTPVAPTYPIVRSQCSLTQGMIGPTKHIFTTRIYAISTANSVDLPAYARTIRAEVARTSVDLPTAGKLPLTYCGVYHEWRGAQLRSWQINDLVDQEMIVSHDARCEVSAPGYRRLFYNIAANAINTERFRLVFGIEV